MRHPIPSAALTQHIVVLGKTRSGKSSKMRLLVEQLLDDKKPVCVIDPKGDWWGLKSSADGKKAGYEVVIFGGHHTDVPINAHSGKVVGELVATGNRPCIIDLGGWMVGERTRFFIDFASTLFTRTHGHRWLVIDECHNFAPQGKVQDPQAGMSLHWANRLASEGAGKGIVLISASQRPQKVHKDYVTSHETLIAARVIHKLDRDADKDWIDACGDPEKGKEVLNTLAGLQRSQAWVYSPEIGFGPKLIDFPMFKTYDSFAVQTGKAGRKLKGWASVDLDEVKTKLASVIEEDKAKDPKELRAQLAEKNREITKLQQELAKATTKAAPAKPGKDALAAAEKRGFEQAMKKLSALRAALEAAMKFIIEINAKDFFKAGGEAVDKKAVEKAITDATQHVTKLIEKHLERRDKELGNLRAEGQRIIARLKAVIDQDVSVKVDVRHNEPFTISADKGKPQRPLTALRPAPAGDGTIGGVQQKILDAVAEMEALCNEPPARTLVAIMSGYKNVKSAGFAKALSGLSASGHVAYPNAQTVAITDSGRELAAPMARPTTSEEVQERVIRIMGATAGKILSELIATYPAPMDREELASRTGYQNVKSAGFAKSLSRMSALGFVSYPSPRQAVAGDVLFPAEA